MDIFILTFIVIGGVGVYCTFQLVDYLKSTKKEILTDESAECLVDDYLYILDNYNDLDEQKYLKENLIMKMRQNKAQRELRSIDSQTQVVKFSDYQTK